MKTTLVTVFALIVAASARPQAPAASAAASASAAPAAPAAPAAAAAPAPAPAPAAPKAAPAAPQHPAAAQSGSTPVSIVSQSEEIGVDGTFNFSYETSDGIKVEQNGSVKKGAEGRALNASNPEDTGDVQVIQGSYSYTAPDGQQIQLSYVADDNGFQPQGAHLPTTPPVPEGIAKSLAQDQQQQPQEQQQYTANPSQTQQ